MASTMASTFALSRPSEKFGTHSTSVDITGKNIGWVGEGATQRRRDRGSLSRCGRSAVIRSFRAGRPVRVPPGPPLTGAGDEAVLLIHTRECDGEHRTGGRLVSPRSRQLRGRACLTTLPGRAHPFAHARPTRAPHGPRLPLKVPPLSLPRRFPAPGTHETSQPLRKESSHAAPKPYPGRCPSTPLCG